MWVRRIACGSQPSSAASTFSTDEVGPGSPRPCPTCQQQTARRRPRWSVSISRIQLVKAGCTIPAEAVTTFRGRAVWGRGVVREALRCRVGNGVELAREVTSVTDDALTLCPDPVGIEVELVNSLFRHGGDVGGVTRRL